MNSLPKFPSFDYDADKTNAGPRWEKYVNCLENLTSSMEPLKMSDMPEKPWENLSADFCGPLPTGKYLFVIIIDEHSQYPVAEIVNSVSANTMIPILDKVISQFGCPKVIKTDNGGSFQFPCICQLFQTHRFHPSQNNTLMAPSECSSRVVQQTSYEVHSNSAVGRQELASRNAQVPSTIPIHTPPIDKVFPFPTSVWLKPPNETSRNSKQSRHRVCCNNAS